MEGKTLPFSKGRVVAGAYWATGTLVTKQNGKKIAMSAQLTVKGQPWKRSSPDYAGFLKKRKKTKDHQVGFLNPNRSFSAPWAERKTRTVSVNPRIKRG